MKILAKALVDKASVQDDGTLEAAVASTPVEDRHGETIDQEGWDLKNFKKNPVLLWAHGLFSAPPIGKVEKVWVEGAGKSARLMFKPRFDLNDFFAAEVFRKIKDGFLNTFSVGFMPIEQDGPHYIKQELLEISAVNVPANPDARVLIRTADGVEYPETSFEELQKIVATAESEKAVVPFAATQMADEGRAWDAGAAIKRIKDWAIKENGDVDWAKYKKAFAWYDAEKADIQGSYKLPHHDIEGNELVVVWRACAAAMAVLMGGRGGADIPESDRRGIYNHLKKHYAQFDKETPEFSMIEDQVMKSLEQEIEAAFGLTVTVQVNAEDVKKMIKEAVDEAKKKITSAVISQKTEEEKRKFAEALKVINQASAHMLGKLKADRLPGQKGDPGGEQIK